MFSGEVFSTQLPPLLHCFIKSVPSNNLTQYLQLLIQLRIFALHLRTPRTHYF